MANEITVSGALQAQKTWSPKSVTQSNIQFTMTGTNVVQASQTIPTTAGGTAINLGNLANVGFYFIRNLDPTNFVELLNAVSGTPMIKLLPAGGFSVGCFHSTITAPALLASTASCLVEYLIAEI